MKNWSLYILILFGGCVETVPLNLDESEQFIAIEGRVTDQSNSQVVTVMKTPDLKEDPLGTSSPISGALVTITDDLGNETLLTEVGNGSYITNTLAGEVGRSYWVEVIVDGKTYRSTAERLLPVAPLGELKFQSLGIEELNENDNIVTNWYAEMLTSFQVPSNTDNAYLKWDVTGVYRFTDIREISPSVCYISTDYRLNYISIFGEPEVAGQWYEDYNFLTVPVSEAFSVAYCLHIEQSSISQGVYEFYDKIKTVKDFGGSLFDPPPGLIRGNITSVDDPSEIVLGYFYASSVVKTIECLKPNEIQGSNGFGCPGLQPENNGSYPDCFCETRANASPTRPSYWP